MKQLKRSLALLLAVAVMCGLLVTGMSAMVMVTPSVTITPVASPKDPAGAVQKFITSYTDVADSDAAAEAIYALSAMGYLKGYPDGSFKPQGSITRAEFAVFVYCLKGYGDNEKAYFAAKPSAFNDVAEGLWSEPFINACADLGLFVGYPDGSFKPNNPITLNEVVAVLLRILGYDKNLPYNWPLNYITKAQNMGLIPVTFNGGEDATRADVAQISYDLLDYYLVYYLGDSNPDNNGYAYTTWLTNEKRSDEPCKLIWSLGFDYDVVSTGTGTGSRLKEANGWNIDNSGSLSIVTENDDKVLADDYYILGGTVVDLGGRKNVCIIYDASGNVVFSTLGRSNGNALSYPEAYIFDHADEYFIWVKPVDSFYSEPIPVNPVFDKSRPFIFYNLDTNEFVDLDSLKEFDVLFFAGNVNGAYLILVQSPVSGNFTKWDENNNGAIKLTIDGTAYVLAEDFMVSLDGGKIFVSLDYEDLNGTIHDNLTADDSVVEFGEVLYGLDYEGNVLFLVKDIIPEFEPTFSVEPVIITSYSIEVVDTIKNPCCPPVDIYGVTGVNVFDLNGETRTIKFADMVNTDETAPAIPESCCIIEEAFDFIGFPGDMLFIGFDSEDEDETCYIVGHQAYLQYVEIPYSATAEQFVMENIETLKTPECICEVPEFISEVLDLVAQTVDLKFEDLEIMYNKFLEEEAKRIPDTVTKLGDDRIKVECGTINNRYSFAPDFEVYTIAPDAVGFYVNVNINNPFFAIDDEVEVTILTAEDMAFNAEFYQFQFWRDNPYDVNINFVYATGMGEDEPAAPVAPTGDYECGILTEIFKDVNGWQAVIDGENYVLAKDATILGDDIDEFNEYPDYRCYALFTVNKDGEIKAIKQITDQNWKFFNGAFAPNDPENKLCEFESGYSFFICDGEDIILITEGNDRVFIDSEIEGLTTPTLYIDGKIFDTKGNEKTVEDLFVAIYNDREIGFVVDENTESIIGIIIADVKADIK